MLPAEGMLVWGLIRGRQDMVRKKKERVAAALAEAANWREKLAQEVVEWHGQDFGAWVLPPLGLPANVQALFTRLLH